MKADLVLQGGGVKGIGLVGAIYALEEAGYTFNNLLGTSCGAFIASLIAAGYTASELKSEISEINFRNFKDSGCSPSIFNLFLKKGMYSGIYAYKTVYKLLKKKGVVTFNDISKGCDCRLKMMATDITRKRLVVLPDDLPDYGCDPNSFEIAKAVRMSIGIPYFFRPVVLGKSFIVDGAVLSNFPIWFFDSKNTPRWPTFGLKFEDNIGEVKPLKRTNFFDYSVGIIETILEKNEQMYCHTGDSVRIISVPTNKIKSTNFNITLNEAMQLFNNGYAAAYDFLNSWSFDLYVKTHRS